MPTDFALLQRDPTCPVLKMHSSDIPYSEDAPVISEELQAAGALDVLQPQKRKDVQSHDLA